MVQSIDLPDLSTDYSHVDSLPGYGLYFYRLKKMDSNGQVHTTELQEVLYAFAGELKIFPNPASQKLFIQYHASKAGNILIRMVDEKGSIVFQRNQQVEQGITTLEIQVSDFARGVYLLSLQGEAYFQRKWVKR